LALGTVQENGRSMRRYIFLSPFDWVNLKLPNSN
jgi:hypothetical protein